MCSSALAAAEIIAALRGRPAPNLPDEVRSWLARYPGAPGEELTAVAQKAVGLILTGSELAELWQESPDEELWRGAVAELRARLE